MKEKIVKEVGMRKSQKKLIHSIYRHRQFWSKRCLKGNFKRVKQMLRKLSSDTARRRFLQEQIEMRVDGLGGDFAKCFSIT